MGHPPSNRDSLTVYLVRHGQTESNRQSRYAGTGNEPLNRIGRNQVQELASVLRDHDVRQIRTSAIARARETAGILGDVLDSPVVIDERLNEMRMGPWEGMTERDVARVYRDAYRLWLKRPDMLRLSGRETLDMVAQRVRPALHDAVRTRGRKVLVSHVAPIRVMVLLALRRSLRHYKSVGVRNAECFMVDVNGRAVFQLGEGGARRVVVP